MRLIFITHRITKNLTENGCVGVNCKRISAIYASCGHGQGRMHHRIHPKQRIIPIIMRAIVIVDYF